MSCANSGPPRAEAAARAVRRTAFIYIIHTRQQRTAAERISEKGRSRRRSVKNRRLFDPQKCEASDLAQSRDRPRNRFTAAAFGLPFGRAKGNVYFFRNSGSSLRGSRNERMRIAGLRGAEAAARTVLRTAILQNLSSAAAGVAPKVRAAEDNTAKRCADACGLMQFEELRAGVTFYEKRVDIRAAGCAPNA